MGLLPKTLALTCGARIPEAAAKRNKSYPMHVPMLPAPLYVSAQLPARKDAVIHFRRNRATGALIA